MRALINRLLRRRPVDPGPVVRVFNARGGSDIYVEGRLIFSGGSGMTFDVRDVMGHHIVLDDAGNLWVDCKAVPA